MPTPVPPAKAHKSSPWAKPSAHTRAHLPIWRRYPKANRRIVIAGAFLLALWLAAWVLVPMAKGYVEQRATEALGRTVTIGAIEFKPWTLELTVRNIAVAGATGANTVEGKPKPPLLTIRRVYVDAELQSLLRFAPVVDAIEVDQPHLQLTHLGDGHYDAEDVVQRLMAEPKSDSSTPPRLALYNLALQDGAIEIMDNSVNTTHSVKALHLSLPFISTLSTHRKVKLNPAIAMDINGVHFESQASATPFGEQGAGQVHWRWSGVDLAPYLAYWPASLPVRLQQASVDMDMTLSFEQHPHTALTLRGMVQAHQVKITDRQGKALLGYERLRLDMADVRPLERIAHLSRITLTQPAIDVSRNTNGVLNWQALSAASSTTLHAAKTATATPASPWQLAIDHVAIEQGQVNWNDAAIKPAAALQVQAIDVNLSHVSWPLQQSAQLQGSLRVPGGTLALQGIVNPQGMQLAPPDKSSASSTPSTPSTEPAVSTPATPADDSVKITTPPEKISTTTAATPPKTNPKTTPKNSGLPIGDARVNLQLQGFDLQALAPYLASYVRPQLVGQAHADISVQWQPPAAKNAAQSAAKIKAKPQDSGSPDTGLTIQAHSLSLKSLALLNGKVRLAGWQDLTLSDVAIAPDAHTVRIGSAQLQQPVAIIARNRQGLWMLDDWLQTAPQPASASGVDSPPPQPTPQPTPWALQIDQWALQKGAFTYEDAAAQRPVQFALTDVEIQTGSLRWPWSLGATPKAANSPFTFSARMSEAASTTTASSRAQRKSADAAGSLRYQGTFGLAPINVKGALQAKRLPLHTVEGYLADFLSIEMLRAYASYEGDVAWSQPASGKALLSAAGNARLDDLRVLSAAVATDDVATPAGEELLAWKSLQLQGVSVELAPEKAPKISIAQTSLSDFFARITLAANGQLNLGQILKKPAVSSPADVAADTTTKPPTPAITAANKPTDTHTETTATPAAQDPFAPIINLGPTSLVNGRVLFDDNFIKPNYSADLSDLTGQLSAFSSQPKQGPPQLADLSLRGIAEGSADLEITGQLNPLAQPLVLNIEGKMHNLDLPPLSPYAIKYAGHGIQRGKLSVDVQYKVAPDGKLSANNRIVLNQLQFGDAVEGAPNSLPVRLAVALLADSKGVIDLDLPVSGSINDPSFSVGPIIFKAIINIIGKALISPFSLLSKAIGGDADLSSVPFAPGSSTLNPEAQTNLQKIAKALLDRPALQVTITGTSYLAQEREGLQREQLAERLLAEKRRQKPDAAPAANTEMAASERTALIQSLYQRTDMPKPKNALGFVKDIPVADMEKLLLASITPTPRMAVDLARQRAAAIQHFLLAQKLPANRVLIAAPTSLTQAPADAKPWVPKAELNLAMP